MRYGCWSYRNGSMKNDINFVNDDIYSNFSAFDFREMPSIGILDGYDRLWSKHSVPYNNVLQYLLVEHEYT